MGSQFPPKSPLLESTNRGQKQRSEIEADPEEERRGREIESIEGRLLIRVPFTDGGSLRFSSHAINDPPPFSGIRSAFIWIGIAQICRFRVQFSSASHRIGFALDSSTGVARLLGCKRGFARVNRTTGTGIAEATVLHLEPCYSSSSLSSCLGSNSSYNAFTRFDSMGVDGESFDDGGKSSAGLDGGDSIGGGSVMWSWERWMQAILLQITSS
ncbi:unnamed protein product [Musa banksii]